MAQSLLNRGGNHCERPPVFSVTPEPAASKPAYASYDSQARQARPDQTQTDGFAALVDSNAGSERPARPPTDAPRRDARGNDTPAPAKDRPQSDTSSASSNNDSGKAQQNAEPSKTDASTPDSKPADKTKSASGDSKSDDTSQDSDAATTTSVPVIPAIVTDPVAVVIAAAAAPAAVATDETAAAATTAATAAIASASAVITPADASAVQAVTAAETAAAGAATAKTDTSATATEAAAPETIATKASAAAQVIKSDSGKTETVAKDGETTTPAKDAKNPKHAADPSAKAETDQAIKPEAGSEHTGDKSQPHEKAASESGLADTDASKHATKVSPQTEHRTAAATPQPLQPADPTVLQPATTLQQPIQTHAANLTAVPVPAANSALADAPVPLNGLAADIALRAAGGSSRFEIRLDPAELGRIDVRLDVDKHGNVTSHLTVERPATLDMLRNDAPRLQQALEDAGLKTGDSGLQFSLRDQSSSGRDGDNGSGRNSQRVVIAEEDTVPAQVAGRTYGRMLGSSSGVDISI